MANVYEIYVRHVNMVHTVIRHRIARPMTFHSIKHKYSNDEFYFK